MPEEKLAVNMLDKEFSPLDLLSRIRTRWWIPLVMAVIGGLIGLVFQFLQPKVYESTVVLSVMMNFTQQDLTQFEQDDAFNNTGEIINSTDVYDQLVEQAKE